MPDEVQCLGGGGGRGERLRGRGARGGGRGRGEAGDPARPGWCPSPGAAVDLTLLADLRPDRAPALFLTCVSREAVGAGARTPGGPRCCSGEGRPHRAHAAAGPRTHTARNGSSPVTVRRLLAALRPGGRLLLRGRRGGAAHARHYVHNSPG